MVEQFIIPREQQIKEQVEFIYNMLEKSNKELFDELDDNGRAFIKKNIFIREMFICMDITEKEWFVELKTLHNQLVSVRQIGGSFAKLNEQAILKHIDERNAKIFELFQIDGDPKDTWNDDYLYIYNSFFYPHLSWISRLEQLLQVQKQMAEVLNAAKN